MLLTLLRKAHSFARRPLFEQAWLLPTWLLLGISRLLVLTVPFQSLADHLGHHIGIAPWVHLLDPNQEARARAIGRVVLMATKYTPWVSNCFNQAVTARVLLGLYGIPYSIFFGVSRNATDPSLRAHAWVAAGRVPVTGGRGFGHFAVVSCFVSSPLVISEGDQDIP